MTVVMNVNVDLSPAISELQRILSSIEDILSEEPPRVAFAKEQLALLRQELPKMIRVKGS